MGGFNGRFHQGSLNWNVFFTSIEHFHVYTGSGNDAIVTASGNDGRQLAPQQSGGTYFFVPAQLQAESILTVGATGARPFPAGQGWQPGIVGWRNAVPAGLHSTAVCP